MVGEAILEGGQIERTTSALEPVEALVAQYSLMAFRIAYSILRNHHDAEDAVQECFLRVMKYGKKLRHVRNQKAWLARIAWTVALDKSSRQKTHFIEDEAGGAELLERLADPALAADEQLAAKQTQEMLERMIAGLPEELRYPLQLSTVQELNATEIAEIMGIPEGSVRTRLMRARKLLKDKLSFLLEAQHGSR
jgi:RNA polymerase sigma-70 factor (ECF subfamily)